MKDHDTMENLIKDYEMLLENLRTRLSILNTSVFLLEENLDAKSMKTNEYIDRINAELERIRELIINVPQGLRSN